MTLPIGKLAVAGIALATLAYGLAEFRGPNGYTGLMQKRQQAHELVQQNEKLRNELDRLDKRVDQLRHDPSVQELEIRKRLGMVKEGETVYVIQDKANKPPSAN